MKNSVLLLFGLLALLLLAPHAHAAPWEVLSDVRYIKKGGVKAVRIDFALPVHYESHFPARRGNIITINLRFNLSEVDDISQLPLLQTLLPPDKGDIPLKDVTYLTKNGIPMLEVRFNKSVNFSVSQVMGITSLVIFLPERSRNRETDPIVDPVIQEFIPLSEGTADESLARKMLEDGRKALKNGKNKKAIQIFTKLLSMPQHSYRKISLELLGVARERNNQAAQAKAVYENYLEQFPKGTESIRVKQRLADLIAAQMKPKKKLKQSRTSKRAKKGYESTFDGYFSQFLYYYDNKSPDEGTEVDSVNLSNNVSLDWRVRAADYDVRSRFDANFDYDFIDDDRTDGLEISRAYTKLKNSRKGVFATVGRHSANTAGGFGRVDGFSLGYNFSSKYRGDLVAGYLVDSSNKSFVQTNRPIVGLGMEINKIWRSLNMGPYFKLQKTDGYLDSAVAGIDYSFFDKNTNIFGLVDYDVSYTSLNIFLMRGAYNFNKMIGITGRMDYRNRNLIETSNALICNVHGYDNEDFETLGQYINLLANDPDVKGDPEAQARYEARQCTGNSYTGELGLKFKFSNRRNLNLLVSRANFNRRFRLEDPDEINPDPGAEPIYIIGDSKEQQLNFSTQFITRSTFVKRDTFLIDLRRTVIKDTPAAADEFAKHSDFNTFTVQYRRLFHKAWRTDFRVRVRRKVTEQPNRDTTSVVNFTPSIRMQYRSKKSWIFYSEFGLDNQRQNDDSNNQTLRFFNLGYDWNF